MIYGAAFLGVLAIFWTVFAVSDVLRRRARRKAVDVAALRPGKMGVVDEISTSYAPAEAIRRLEAAFAPRSPVVTRRTDAQLLLFVGRPGGGIQFEGILSMAPEHMPLLVGASAVEGRVRVILDNDFGWNLFMGPARAMYLSLVKKALALALGTAREALKP